MFISHHTIFQIFYFIMKIIMKERLLYGIIGAGRMFLIDHKKVIVKNISCTWTLKWLLEKEYIHIFSWSEILTYTFKQKGDRNDFSKLMFSWA